MVQPALHEPDVSSICFTHGGQLTTITISQKLRPDAIDVVKSLAGLGLDLHILSGDRIAAVKPMAEEPAAIKTAWLRGVLPPTEYENERALGAAVNGGPELTVSETGTVIGVLPVPDGVRVLLVPTFLLL